jgi:hypothetical protein
MTKPRLSGFASPTRSDFRRADPKASSKPQFKHDDPCVGRFKYEPPPMLSSTYWEMEKYTISHTPGRAGVRTDADAHQLGLSNQYLGPGDRWGASARDFAPSQPSTRGGRDREDFDRQPSFSLRQQSRQRESRRYSSDDDHDDSYYGSKRPARSRPQQLDETPVRDVTPRNTRTRSPGARRGFDARTGGGYEEREVVVTRRGEKATAPSEKELRDARTLAASPGWKQEYDFTQRSHRSSRRDRDAADDLQPAEVARHHRHRLKESIEVSAIQIPDSYVVGARENVVVPVRSEETPNRHSRRREGESEEEYRARRRAERELRRRLREE